MTRCERCDKPHATNADWYHPGGCVCATCVTLCWGECDPIDWRARALKAEAAIEKHVSFRYRRGLANAADFVIVRINDDGTEERLCTLVGAQGLHHEDDARRLVALLNGDDK